MYIGCDHKPTDYITFNYAFESSESPKPWL